MTVDHTPSDSSRQSSVAEQANEIRAYVSDLICRVPPEEDFDAKKILREHPELKNYRSLVLDLAYEEYCRHLEKGRSIAQASFAKRFPQYEESLLRVLQVHRYLEEVGDRRDHQGPDWPQPGDKFGEYELEELIGRGSFAYVFIAKQRKVADRRVVLKITRNAFDEIETLGRLEHPNIVQIFTVDTSVKGFTAICMPLISQVTLFDVISEIHATDASPTMGKEFYSALKRCQRERSYGATLEREMAHLLPFELEQRKRELSPLGISFADRILQIGLDVGRALTYAHSKKILHCDIKPTNILIAASGKSMLFDFNLSAVAGSESDRIGGTLPYMPPEQLAAVVDSKSQFQATPALDIFSLGVTLYQTLTGKLPFGDIPETTSQRAAAERLLDRQRNFKARIPRTKGLNRGLRRILESCLAYRPQDRPASAATLVKLLESESSALRRTRRWIVTHPLLTTAAASCLVGSFPIANSMIQSARDAPRRRVEKALAAATDLKQRGKLFGAIRILEKALEDPALTRPLEYKVRLHLAIAYARRGARHVAYDQSIRAKQVSQYDPKLAHQIDLAIFASDIEAKQDSKINVEGKVSILRGDSGRVAPSDLNNLHVGRYHYDRFREAEKFGPIHERSTYDPTDLTIVNFDKYIRLFQSILKQHPQHPEAHFNIYRMQQRQEKRTLSESPTDPFHLFRAIEYGGLRIAYLARAVSYFEAKILKDHGTRESIDEFVYWTNLWIWSGAHRSDVFVTLKMFDEGLQEHLRNRLRFEFNPVDYDVFHARGVCDPLS